MRLFIAIDLPDDLKINIGRLWADTIPGARWVPVEQIHLTLSFLGEVEESAVEPLTEKLAHIHVPAFDLRCGGTGCFPTRHRPRVLWIGVEQEPHLYDLAAKVRAAVLACGIPQEDRHFSPHLTLARLKMKPSSEFDAFLDKHKDLKVPPIHVREFTLFQSQLNWQGAVHVPIKHFPLAAPGRMSGH